MSCNEDHQLFNHRHGNKLDIILTYRIIQDKFPLFGKSSADVKIPSIGKDFHLMLQPDPKLFIVISKLLGASYETLRLFGNSSKITKNKSETKIKYENMANK